MKTLKKQVCVTVTENGQKRKEPVGECEIVRYDDIDDLIEHESESTILARFHHANDIYLMGLARSPSSTAKKREHKNSRYNELREQLESGDITAEQFDREVRAML